MYHAGNVALFFCQPLGRVAKGRPGIDIELPSDCMGKLRKGRRAWKWSEERVGERQKTGATIDRAAHEVPQF